MEILKFWELHLVNDTPPPFFLRFPIRITESDLYLDQKTHIIEEIGKVEKFARGL